MVGAGYEKESTGQYLRVYLDNETGITLDDCERYHRKIYDLLEEAEYDFLEVSSPGLDRPITSPGYAKKAEGCPVEIKLYQPIDGQKQFIGIFAGLDENGYHLMVGERNMMFPIKSVALARRIIDVEQVLAQQAEQQEEESI
ncbi:MAG: ribosome maturation factor RimP [Clostridiales bacterium]|nr:ribosome maturation factor RimP [Clostridiales bacterium]